MKKLILLLLTICLFQVSLFSQTDDKTNNTFQNELKVNVLTLVFLYPEISYERYMMEDFGVGLSAGVELGNETYYKTFHIMPYSRFYFKSKKHRIFFVEANMGLIGSRSSHYDYSYNEFEDKKNVNFGIGFGLGYKWINKSNFTAELAFGITRTFGNNENFFPAFGINIGKQF